MKIVITIMAAALVAAAAIAAQAPAPSQRAPEPGALAQLRGDLLGVRTAPGDPHGERPARVDGAAVGRRRHHGG